MIKPEQLKTLSDLGKIHDYVSDIENKNILFVGDFNVIFYSFLEARGRTPSLKNTLKQKKLKKRKSSTLPIFGESEIPKPDV